MMYGTAFDEITESRHLTGTGGRKGLAGLAYPVPNPNPPGGFGSTYTPTIDVPMTCGIDSSGNPWVMIANQYFYDALSLYNYATSGGDPTYSGATPSPGVKIATQTVMSAIQGLETQHNIPYANWGAQAFRGGWLTLADVVGAIRSQGVPFTAYQPPPPPQAPAAPPPPPPAPAAMPPGFAVFNPAMGIPRVWPIYGANPTFSNGVTSFAGATQFSSLTPGPAGSYGTSVGLDPTKLSAGVYAYKETDLGAIQSSAGRTYELYMLELFDTSTQSSAGTFYETVEGGGGGLLIGDPLALASRIITGISTMGTSEAIRLAAQKAGVPDSTINLATEAYAAAAIAVATAGTIAVLSAPTAAPVVATAETSVSETGGASLLTGEEAATFTVPATVAPDGTVVAATDVAATGAGAGASTGGGLVTAAGATVAKAAGATALAVGTTALSTEIKKLTGQLPAAAQPPVPSTLTIKSGTPKSNTPMIAAGIAAVLLLVKK